MFGSRVLSIYLSLIMMGMAVLTVVSLISLL